ncbi:MAG: Ig-like domain-containing protein [Bifidobacteriaceae bacterium]|jgi:alpha-tubulin suppressor-like RCC1 family protein|nr:Ig-like domain-containing protein [Bifidobacteriaceae bacterium]
MSFKPLTAYVCALAIAATGLVTAHAASAEQEPRTPPPSHLLSLGDYHSAVIGSDGHVWSWGRANQGRLGAPMSVARTPVPVEAIGVADAISVAAAISHTLAATADGDVWTWGVNGPGLLGTASKPAVVYSSAPIRIPELTNAVHVAAGETNSYAVTASGSVYAWGSNSSHLLGDGDTEDSAAPVLVQGPTDVVDVSASQAHTLALSASGDVWAWGNNSDGQLGTVSTEAVTLPRRVENIPPMKAIAAGNRFSLTVDTGGDVWAWGWGMGEILQAPGIDPMSLSPIRIPGIHHVATVAASDFALAVTDSGGVWTWGNGLSGRLGHGNIATATMPSRATVPEPAVAAAVSPHHTAVITTSGTVYLWGNNTHFQLGDESDQKTSHLTRVNGIEGVVSLRAGVGNTVALTANGDVWAWGDGRFGQFGNGTTVSSLLPVKARGLDDITVKTVDVGDEHMLALSDSGRVYAWGGNGHGQLGIGSRVNQSLPVLVDGLPTNVIQAVASYKNSAVVTDSGQVWTWGSNQRRQLGNTSVSSEGSSTTPIRVSTLPPVTAVAVGGQHMVALDRDGDLWVWGDNSYGQLGTGAKSGAYPSPTRLSLGGRVESVACGGNHTIAVMESGTVFAWGDNDHGALGTGNTTKSPVPVEVNGLPAHGTPAAGIVSSLYVTDSSGSFAWGWNDYGQLGDDTWTDSTTAKALSIPNVAIAAMGSTHIALVDPASGAVYTSGENHLGQLGYPSLPWIPTARIDGLNLGTFEVPNPDPSPTDEPTTPPATPPTVDPTENPTTDPTIDPTGAPTSDPTGNPSNPGDDPGHRPGEDATPSHDPASPTGPSATQPGQNRQGSTTAPPSGGQASTPPGGVTIPPAAPVPNAPSISRFGASFTTVIVRQGRTVKVPVVSYADAAEGPVANPPGHARVTWTSTAPKTATIAGSTKATGTWSWVPGTVKTISIRAKKVGATKLVLRSPDARALVLRVRVVPSMRHRAVKTVTVRAAFGEPVPRTMTVGQAVWLKALPHPIGAARVKATWRSTNPAVARIDRAGRLTAVGHGTTTITCRVRGVATKVRLIVS